MRDYAEDDVALALLALKKMAPSIRKAALAYGVPFTTLKDRVDGAQPQNIAFEPFQKLSAVQAEHLAGWIVVQRAMGRPPTYAQIRSIAASVADPSGGTKTLGKNWLQAFLRRNPTIKALRRKSNLAETLTTVP